MTTMEQLITQVQLLTNQVAEQQAIINSGNHNRFQLTAAQIIKNFNDIKAFSGEDSYKLKSFLKSVENSERLCGENNGELKEFCLQNVINCKIIGKARTTILEIPEDRRNWNNVISTLKLRYRPKHTVHQLLFQAKEIKVYNLKDLFNKLTSIKADISEICDFTDEKIFTYENVDKELVLILKSKLNSMLQLQINENTSLFDLDNQFCKSEIYSEGNAIKDVYRISKSNTVDKKNTKINYNKFTPNQNTNFNKPNNSPNKNFNKFNNNVSGQYKPNFNQNNNNSGQYKQGNKSGQIRTDYRPEPMEIDNLVEVENKDTEDETVEDVEEIDEEVNFH